MMNEKLKAQQPIKIFSPAPYNGVAKGRLLALSVIAFLVVFIPIGFAIHNMQVAQQTQHNQIDLPQNNKQSTTVKYLKNSSAQLVAHLLNQNSQNVQTNKTTTEEENSATIATNLDITTSTPEIDNHEDSSPYTEEKNNNEISYANTTKENNREKGINSAITLATTSNQSVEEKK